MQSIKLISGYLFDYLYNSWISHIPIHCLRLFFLRLLGAKIGQDVCVLLHVRILHPWNLKIGNNVVINQYVVLDCRRYMISIGNNTDIGPYTRVWTLSHDPHDDNHSLKGGPVQVGHHVWIASGVTILPNIIIGDGAIIASSSVLTKNVERLNIVAGVPAKKTGMRRNKLNYTLQYTPWWE
jgi:maltose O-acetyltransferase